MLPLRKGKSASTEKKKSGVRGVGLETGVKVPEGPKKREGGKGSLFTTQVKRTGNNLEGAVPGLRKT